MGFGKIFGSLIKAPKMASPAALPVQQSTDPEGSPEEQARRRELLVQARAGGRQGSMVADYALATMAAPTLKATLGGT